MIINAKSASGLRVFAKSSTGGIFTGIRSMNDKGEHFYNVEHMGYELTLKDTSIINGDPSAVGKAIYSEISNLYKVGNLNGAYTRLTELFTVKRMKKLSTGKIANRDNAMTSLDWYLKNQKVPEKYKDDAIKNKGAAHFVTWMMFPDGSVLEANDRYELMVLLKNISDGVIESFDTEKDIVGRGGTKSNSLKEEMKFGYLNDEGDIVRVLKKGDVVTMDGEAYILSSVNGSKVTLINEEEVINTVKSRLDVGIFELMESNESGCLDNGFICLGEIDEGVVYADEDNNVYLGQIFEEEMLNEVSKRLSSSQIKWLFANGCCSKNGDKVTIDWDKARQAGWNGKASGTEDSDSKPKGITGASWKSMSREEKEAAKETSRKVRKVAYGIVKANGYESVKNVKLDLKQMKKDFRDAARKDYQFKDFTDDELNKIVDAFDKGKGTRLINRDNYADIMKAMGVKSTDREDADRDGPARDAVVKYEVAINQLTAYAMLGRFPKEDESPTKLAREAKSRLKGEN